MNTERAYELIAKSISSDLLAAEQTELKRLLAQFPELAVEQVQLAQTWELTSQAPAWEPDTELALSKLKAKIRIEEPAAVVKPFRYRRLMRFAAIGIVLLGVGFLMRNALSTSSNPVDHVAQQNEIEAIQMTDGSTILLDNAAHVTFFPGERSVRKVALTGQAFFDVQRNETKTFIVTTEKATIEVLGTSFNVSATKEATEVVVRTGVVKVTNNLSGEFVTLVAGESVKVDQSNTLDKKAGDQVPFSNYEALLQFDDQPLEKVFQRLGWTFNKQIAWDRTALKSCTLTSNLADKNLEEVLDILKTALNLKETQIDANQVILIGGSCK